MKYIPVLGSLLDRLFVVAGAFAGCQIPEFMHQYSHRLAGHVDELQRLINQLRQTASVTNKTLDEYIQKFLSSSDPDFVRQGDFMHDILFRWQDLHQALTHLTQSSLWGRPFVFLRDLQSDIAYATLNSFQPGINLSLEGLCYAGLGILIGWSAFRLISKGLSFCLSGLSQIVYRKERLGAPPKTS